MLMIKESQDCINFDFEQIQSHPEKTDEIAFVVRHGVGAKNLSFYQVPMQ